MTTSPDPLRCPACASDQIVAGQLMSGGTRAIGFLPEGLSAWGAVKSAFISDGITLPITSPKGSTAHGCAACGHIWSAIDPAALRNLLLTSGTEETVKRFTATG
ncbi:MAG TPA: hypothetical protein VGM20_11120 [Gemmatimonadales bacterium]|jgi:hypothetical protein